MKNLKIGQKLVVCFIIVALLASISGVVSIFTSNSINKQYSDALDNYGFAQGDIGKTMTTLADTRRCVRDVISYTEPKYVNKALEELNLEIESYGDTRDLVMPTLTTQKGRELYDAAQASFEQYKAKADEIVALGNTNDEVKSKAARIMAVEELDPLYMVTYTAWADIMALKVDVGDTLRNNLLVQSRVLNIVNISLAVISLVVSVLIGVVVSRGISKPIGLCVKRLSLLAEGNLSEPVPEVKSKDETGDLANATGIIVGTLSSIIGDVGEMIGEMGNGNFDIDSKIGDSYIGDFNPLLVSMRHINSRLSDTLAQINTASDQVSAGSDQVSSGAQALSQGATEQASSVQELAATINEISQQVKSNAENAKNASNMVNNTGSEVAISNEKMHQLVGAMNEISSSSQEIGKVIKSIEDIAFQTNILALNAAVEAARAGAAGKGFAVVADEVRNLSTKSSEAAKGTTVLIEAAIAAVARGTQLVDDTAKSLESVVTGTQSVVTTVDLISEASNEQAQSIAQVTQGVDQISSVVQTNSATAEESAAASEELSGQAQMLKSLVGTFKLKNSGSAPSAPKAKSSHMQRDNFDESTDKY